MSRNVVVVVLALLFGTSCGGNGGKAENPRQIHESDAEQPESATAVTGIDKPLVTPAITDCTQNPDLMNLKPLLIPLGRGSASADPHDPATFVAPAEIKPALTSATGLATITGAASTGTIDPPALSNVPKPRILTPSALEAIAPQLNAAERDATRSFVRQTIIGGNPVDDKTINPYPWASLLVMIRDNTSIPFCSGALVTPRLVLTAAHCAVLFKAGDVVFVGGTNLEDDPGESRLVTARAIHQCFDAQTHSHDIALVQLNADLENTTLPLAPAGTSADQPPQPVRIVSWGRGSAPGTLEVKQLQELTVELVDQSVCEASYPESTITSNMLCAGTLGATSCYGDSGGPLVAQAGGAQQVIGAASFTGHCIEPGVFSRVSAYSGWLSGLVGG